MKRAILTLLFIGFFSNSLPGAEKQYDLKIAYPAGTYEIRHEFTSASTSGLTIGETNETDVIYYELVVEPKKSDGTQTGTLEWKRIIFKSKFGNRETDYDSDKGKPQARREINKSQLLGLKLKLNFDKNGSVTKVDGLNEFIEELTTRNPSEKQKYDMMKALIKDDMLVSFFAFFDVLVPKKPVSLKETWTNRTDVNLTGAGEVPLDVECKLMSIEGADGKTIAMISAKGKFESKDTVEIKSGPLKFKYKDVNIESKLGLKIEIETGLVLGYIARTESDTTMVLRDSTMPASSKTSFRVDITRK